MRWMDLLSVLALLFGGCGTLSPELMIEGPLSVDGDPVLFVVAAKQKAEAVASLRGAGFTVSDDVVHASHLLRVTLGVDKSIRSCGTLNNVSYALRKDGRQVLRIKSRGWTGSCEPNVFDDMAQAMAQAFRQDATPRGSKEGSR